MPPELPRVLRRALGLMRFAREAVDASAAGDVSLGKAAMALLMDVGRRCTRALGRGPALLPPADARWLH